MNITRPAMRSTRNILLTFQPSTRNHEITLPRFLLPAFANAPSIGTTHFSTSTRRESKIGAAPLTLPPDVTFQVLAPETTPADGSAVSRTQTGATIEITGPLGKLKMSVPGFIRIAADEDKRTRSVSVADATVREQRAMWGTVRAYLNNHILGVSEGHTVILRIVGVGYRASVEATATTKTPAYPGQKFVTLKIGYSHPIEMGIPEGVKASTPQPTRILLEGVDKEAVTKFAHQIRDWRRPEPYKGKGIFVNDETIRLKAKKIK